MTTKKRLDHEGSVYQRKSDGRWCASVSLPPRPDGSRNRRTVYGRTKTEALDAKARLLREAAGGTRAPRPKTVDAYLAQWVDVTLAHRVDAGELSPSTLDQYRRKIANNVTGTTLGKTRLSDVDPATVRAWLRWLAKERITSRGKHMTPGGVSLVFRVLRSALQDAVDDGILEKNPAANVRPPYDPGYVAHPLTVDDARRILADRSPWRPLWATFLLLGLRHGEALTLRWSDVEHLDDPARARVRVRRTLADTDTGTVPHERTKTRASTAAVPIPEPLRQMLVDHRATQRLARAAAYHWDDPTLVFATSVGTVHSRSNVRRAWLATCRRVGVEPCRPHDLRHTTASLLYATGTPVEAISKILRHRSPTITRNLYVHVFEDVTRDAATRLGDYLGGQG